MSNIAGHTQANAHHINTGGQSGGASRLRAARSGLLVLAALTLVACGDPAKERLLGERLDPRTGEASVSAATGAAVENKSVKINLGAQVSRSAWTHVGADAQHMSGHNAFTSGQPALAWAADIGKGNSRKFRISTTPVAANGVVVAMDSGVSVSAVSAISGAPLWSVDLTPAGEKAGDANGGTLAIEGTTVFATTGYGELVALDLTSGSTKWRQKLDAVGAGGLAVRDGLVYVVGGNGLARAVDANDGRIRWETAGPDSVTTRIGAASPALTDRLVIFPFATGDLTGAFRKGGVRLWSSTLAGSRKGVAYATTSDITSGPVVVGDTLYAGNQSGRFGAYAADSGKRLWTAREGAYSPAVVLGGSVFVVSDRNQLVRLDAASGSHIWAQQLPLYDQEKPRRRKGVYAHYGPVAAGGKLWVASSDGVLRGYAPDSGVLAAQLALPKGAASDPIVVGGVMYVMLDDGSLAAIR